MSVYFFAWVASISFGVEGIVAKLISKHSVANAWLFNFLWTLFILLFTIPIALYFKAGIPIAWNYILFGAIFSALASILNTLSLYRLDISVLVPLFSFRTAMAVVAGSFFIHEILTTHQYFLIFIIFIFGIFVSVDEHFSLKPFFSKNTLIALSCMFCLVVSSIFFKEAVTINGFWSSILWTSFLAQFFLLFTIPLFKSSISNVSSKQYGAIILVAVIGVLGTLTANAAYAKNVSLASVIISLPFSMIIAFLFSQFAPELLEKHSLKVYVTRFISAAIMIVAALNL